METLGTRLKSEREKKKLTLEKVSELTKIRPHIIKAFEDGNFQILPAVYAKSFIISYAKFLQIKESQIKDEIDEIFGSKLPKPAVITEPVAESRRKPEINKSEYRKFNLSGDNKAKIVNILIYIVIVIAFALVIYFTIFDSVAPESDDQQVEDSTETTKADTADIKAEDKGLFSFYEEPDSLILQAKANDSSWLKITIDGKISESFYMAPNMEKRWSAADFFLITLGNAGAVEFRRNGELLPKLGKPGTVVRNVKITDKEVVNSSKPWSSDSVTEAFIPKKKFFPKKKDKILNHTKILEPATIEKTKTDLLQNLKPDSEMPQLLKKKIEPEKPLTAPKEYLNILTF